MFLAIGMAACAVGDVTNAFIAVFMNHFLLIMAVGAGVAARVVARMADGAVAVGPFVIDGEGMIEGGPGKSGCVMAGRALARVMIGRCQNQA